MKPIGKIDSMNFNSIDVENIFNNKNDYIVETVKSNFIFNPKRWREAFGKKLTRNIIEAKILHTSTGLEIPLKRYAINPKKQTVEFAGLHSYNQKSIFLQELLNEHQEQLEECFISRVDVAIDFKGKIPPRIIKKLCEDRKPFIYANTTYYKTKNEKKSNPRINIKKYNKRLKSNLDYDLERLEFVFQGSYFKNNTLKDMEILIKKMGKSIKRFSNLDIKILLLEALTRARVS